MKLKQQLLVVFFLVGTAVFAQQKEFNGDPDVTFETARKLAFNGARKQAQDSLIMLLKKYPNYHDIRSFLASTYSWDGNYKLAKKEFQYVLEKDPKNETTWVAAINNELWSEAPFSALEMANQALEYFPNSEEILLVKAKAEENSQNPEDALKTVQEILNKNPNNKEATEFKESLNQSLRFNAIGISSSVDLYSEVFDPMQFYTLKYKRQTKYGSIIAKGNFSRRFNDNGAQFEVDLYPKIAKGLYAYLNIGFSNSYLYPDVRFGAELHQSLPHSFEISLGMRSLKYTSTTNIYTGSIGWYTGNSYWSFRPYFTPGDSGTSTSGTLNYRKYSSDADNYFSIAAGIGFSPELYRFNFEGNEDEIIKLESQKINFGYYFTSKSKQNAWGTQFGISHQEISFDPGNFFWVYSLGISWELKFK
ncbi:YaiO family outer membrane beta-barrel protein [Lutibacter maritimus]|uniref:Outer membrane protein, YaiO family n=1 Tax=Lutibacter maritimus TaxID=593133 RepID=A0A1I6Q5Q5_9FLAO|nr:YaiO family outer membrane beta-barrel protein [Lutibacter maritimus]SFS47793.1 outer membrane protein, YaiO family [Lutibacter maritimus]